MEKETTINGFKCKFIDNNKDPECNFFCVTILHDSKYNKVWDTMKFKPEEMDTRNKRVSFVGSHTMLTQFPGKSLSIFVFTYMDYDDLVFIKDRVTFFFKELPEKEENKEGKKDKEPYILIQNGNRMEIIALLNKRLGIKLSILKDSVTKNAFNDVQIRFNEEMPDIKRVYGVLDWENYNPKIYYAE